MVKPGVSFSTTIAEMLADVIPLIAANRVQIVSSTLTPQEISQGFDFAQNAERVTSILNERLARESVAAGLFSALFEGKRLIQRHQMVYGALGDRMRSEIHALSMRTLTPAEYQAKPA